jgi:hypothetical protein
MTGDSASSRGVRSPLSPAPRIGQPFESLSLVRVVRVLRLWLLRQSLSAFRPTVDSIAVLGSWNAGQALAGDLARRALTSSCGTERLTSSPRSQCLVKMEGELTGFGKLRLVTSEIAETLADATVDVRQ